MLGCSNASGKEPIAFRNFISLKILETLVRALYGDLDNLLWLSFQKLNPTLLWERRSFNMCGEDTDRKQICDREHISS